MPKKNNLKNLVIKEVSSVDNPACDEARVIYTKMKSTETQGLFSSLLKKQAVSFDEIQDAAGAIAGAYGFLDGVSSAWWNLDAAFSSIINDNELDLPSKITALEASVTQFNQYISQLKDSFSIPKIIRSRQDGRCTDKI